MSNFFKTLTGNSFGSQESSPIASQIGQMATMGWRKRVWGFAICFILGFALTISSFFFIAFGFRVFALVYTTGNLMSISSTFFLMGPAKQFKEMFKKERFISSAIMLLLLIATLLAIFRGKSLAAIILCIFQFLALLWYALSYIPYTHEMIKRSVVQLI